MEASKIVNVFLSGWFLLLFVWQVAIVTSLKHRNWIMLTIFWLYIREIFFFPWIGILRKIIL